MILFKYGGGILPNGHLDYPFSDSVGPVRTFRIGPFFNGLHRREPPPKSLAEILGGRP